MNPFMSKNSRPFFSPRECMPFVKYAMHLFCMVLLMCSIPLTTAFGSVNGKTFWSTYVNDSEASGFMEIYRYEEIGVFRIYISCFKQSDAGTEQVTVVIPNEYFPALIDAQIKELEISVPKLTKPVIMLPKSGPPGLAGAVTMRFVSEPNEVRRLISVLYAGYKRYFIDEPAVSDDQREAYSQRKFIVKIRGIENGADFELQIAFSYTGTYAAYKLAEVCSVKPALLVED